MASRLVTARASCTASVPQWLTWLFPRYGKYTKAAVLHDNGFRFDMGPTFFLYPRVLSDIFAACGKDLSREVDLIRLDPQQVLSRQAQLDVANQLAQEQRFPQAAEQSPAIVRPPTTVGQSVSRGREWGRSRAPRRPGRDVQAQ